MHVGKGAVACNLDPLARGGGKAPTSHGGGIFPKSWDVVGKLVILSLQERRGLYYLWAISNGLQGYNVLRRVSPHIYPTLNQLLTSEIRVPNSRCARTACVPHWCARAHMPHLCAKIAHDARLTTIAGILDEFWILLVTRNHALLSLTKTLEPFTKNWLKLDQIFMKTVVFFS